jgi:hypothetical protein
MFVWRFWSRAAKNGARSEASQGASGDLARCAARTGATSSTEEVSCTGAQIRRPGQDNRASLSATYVYVDNFR